MSSVFKSSPKVVNVQPQVVETEIVDNSEIVREQEKRRKKKFGAVAQLLSHENSYSGINGSGNKTTLGG